MAANLHLVDWHEGGSLLGRQDVYLAAATPLHSDAALEPPAQTDPQTEQLQAMQEMVANLHLVDWHEGGSPLGRQDVYLAAATSLHSDAALEPLAQTDPQTEQPQAAQAMAGL